MTRTVNINSNNLLTNGDFRIDPNATWTLYNSFINKSYCHNGSYSVEFLGGENNSYIQQSVAVTPLKSYLIRGAFAKLGSGEGAPVNILVQFYSKESKLLKIGLYASLFASDLEDVREGKWFPYWGYTIEAPENSSYALIIINKISSKNSVPVLGSNFAFKEAEL
ncbi:NTTRR-F1 domain [Alkaliphilus pronyensis]|uniref:NTTRR-F1 domain n=2 Tax=Alkaliphilus pronyensis TaxID=1482732 RepID=A0A6I0FKJ0_9FIRM|nr:NTTRR-F1 domain [Alkaliphilus pronyensis]